MKFQSTLRPVALISVLALICCDPVWDEDKYKMLEEKWTSCNFPPNQTKADDILGHCRGNTSLWTNEGDALLGIGYICSLFEAFARETCSTAMKEDIAETSKIISDFIATRDKFYLCDVGAGYRTPDSVQEVMDETTCKVVCSGQAAESLCRVIVIFSLADYQTLKRAADDTKKLYKITKSEDKSTHEPSSQPTEAPVSQTFPEVTEQDSDNSTNINGTTISKLNDTQSTAKPAKPAKPTKPVKPTVKPTKPVKTGSITYGKLAIYGVSFLIVCAIIFSAYMYRDKILYCLRESHGGGPAMNDGKGGYRKVPNFEKVLPNIEDREKAKTFIY